MAFNRSKELPNRLTVLRIILVIFMIAVAVIPFDKMGITFASLGLLGSVSFTFDRFLILVFFGLGVLTDFLDGHLARKWQVISSFGKLMDPIADKLLVNSLFILLTSTGEIPALVTIIMVARDIFVDGLRLIMVEQGKIIAASPLGKLKTATQMLALILVVLYNYPFSLINLPVAEIVVYLAAVISFASGVDYFYRNRKNIVGSK